MMGKRRVEKCMLAEIALASLVEREGERHTGGLIETFARWFVGSLVV